MRYLIQDRHKVEVNTDPQRRCYYGVHARSEWQWTRWEVLQVGVPSELVQERLTFWRELNDYAVSQRGESARKEFRAVPETSDLKEEG